MKIVLAQHFGLCFGVRDAIAQAEELARQGPLTILGELVHNPIVREKLRAQGVREGSLTDEGLASDRVMITAHGTSDRQRRKWREAGFDVADGTCPLVRRAHEQLKRLVAAGYFPIVIGQAGHVEVRGLVEDFAGAVVLNAFEEVASLPIRDRYGVISQTTQPIAHVQRMVEAIRRFRPDADVLFADTVCKPTKDRQDALQSLLAQVDALVVVGGRESNNTRQLVETCRAAGRRAFHVERPTDVDAIDFTGVTAIGLTAGTSTLPETVAAVLKRLQEISIGQASNPKPQTPG